MGRFDGIKNDEDIKQMCFYGNACDTVLQNYIDFFNETSKSECNLMSLFYKNFTSTSSDTPTYQFKGDSSHYMRMAAYSLTLFNLQYTIQNVYYAVNSTDCNFRR